MSAIWLEKGALSLRDDLPIPSPPRGEALVRVLLAGICATDLELVRGYYPYTGVPGHEFVGVVEEGPGELLGRRVVGEINAACGRCESCRAGRRSHCPGRSVLGIVNRNGAFAEYLLLPPENLHAVPDALPGETAVFTEPLAAALRILEQVALGPETRALVVGDGKLGQLIAPAMARAGCDPSVAGKDRQKLAILAGRGIRTLAPEEVKERAFDLAVECTGNPEGFALALGALRPGGTLVMKSTYAADLRLRADAIVVDEITVIGSRCGPFAPALRMLAEGGLEVAPLIHGRYPLSRGLEAFEHARRPGALKILLEVGSGA